jgi:hypothetical protein
VLLTQGVLLLGLLPKLRISRRNVRPVYILFLVVALIVIPDLVLTIKRFLEPIPQGVAEYRRTPGWYETDLNGARMNVAASQELVAHLTRVRMLVPDEGCIYGIKPSVIGYYAGRISIIPPLPHFDEAVFDAYLKKSDCRYFYLLGFSSPSFHEPYYPLARMRESLRIINVSMAATAVSHSGPIGMLAVLERH